MKFSKVGFIEHPLFSGDEFDFKDESGKASPICIVAGQNGTGKTMLLESLACLGTRFKNHQPAQKAVFHYELTDEEFHVLTAGKLNLEDHLIFKKNQLTIINTSKFLSGRFMNQYEFFLTKNDGQQVEIPDLTGCFAQVRKVIYLPINLWPIQCTEGLSLDLNLDLNATDGRTQRLVKELEQ